MKQIISGDSSGSIFKRMRFQYAIVAALLISITGIGLAYMSSQDESDRLQQNMQMQAEALSVNVATSVADYILDDDFASIEIILLRAIKFPGVLSVSVTNSDGTVYGHVVKSDNGTYEARFNLPTMMLPGGKKSSIRLLTDKIIIWAPVQHGSLIGWVNLELSLHTLHELQNDVLINNILNSLFAAFLITFFLLYFFRRPVQDIEEYTRFALGLIESPGGLVKVSTSTHELESLGEALNEFSILSHEQAEEIKADLSEVAKLAAISENSPEIIMTIGLDGKVLFSNYRTRLLAEVFGLDDSELMRILPDNIDSILHKCVADGAPVREVEKHFLDKIILWSFSPLLSQQVVHCYGVDVTRSRLAEKKANQALLDKANAEGANEAKSTFLANMSHEIRTPLTAIIGFSESLLDTEISMQERVGAINTVIRNAKHLLQLINDILDLTKIESGKLQIEKISVSVFDLINDIYLVFEAEAKNKGLKFEVDYQYPMPVHVNTDPVRLKQVVMNLCSNAVKFTSQGYVLIKVSYAAESSQLRFDIEDTGVGLSQEQIESLFNPFQQADASITRKFGGTGLGLYVSRQLAEILGGHIEVASEQGKGSCFTLLISCGVSDSIQYYEDESQVEHNPIIDSPVYSEQFEGTVLLVEDSLDNQQLISMYIHKAGATVELANNGEIAVEKIKHKTYDLVLMDMQMPVLDGLSATRQIRTCGYKNPVVMLTANAMREDVDRCLLAGCDDYFTKPIDRQKFNEMLAKYLKRQERLPGELPPVKSTLLDEGPEFEAIVVKFNEQLPGLIKELSELYQRQDMDAFKDKIHGLKGTGGNMGYIDVTNICSQIEFALAKDASEEIEHGLISLQNLCHRILLTVKTAGE